MSWWSWKARAARRRSTCAPADIANMGFAEAACVPVVLAGDIDRGGVIAQIVGTQAVLDPDDAARIEGFLINRFRGDPRLFDDGYARIAAQTGWRGFGVLPWFADAWRLPAEDALDLDAPERPSDFHIVCLALSRIANFDDLDPLKQEPGVRLTMLGPGRAIPGDADLVILPGDENRRAAIWPSCGRRAGTSTSGRMSGAVVTCWAFAAATRCWAAWWTTPRGSRGRRGATEGLGFLQVETVMTPEKRLTEVDAVHAATGRAFHGYEIHIGRTEGAGSRTALRPSGRCGRKGAADATGRVQGSYLHGMFRDDGFRAAVARRVRRGRDRTILRRGRRGHARRARGAYGDPSRRGGPACSPPVRP